MSKKRIIALSTVAVSMLALTACGGVKEPEQSPEEVVKTGLENHFAVKSAEYSLELMAEAEGENSPFSTASLALAGAFDLTSVDSLQFSMSLDGSVTMGEDVQAAKGEVRVVDGMAYLKADEIPTQLSAFLPDTSGFVGNWYSTAVPADAASLEAGVAQFEAAGKQLADSGAFVDLEFQGGGKIGDAKTYHYTGKLDFNKLNSMGMAANVPTSGVIAADSEEATAVQTDSMPADFVPADGARGMEDEMMNDMETPALPINAGVPGADIATMAETLNNNTVDIHVGVDDMTVRAIHVNITVEDEMNPGTITIKYEFPSVGGDVSVEAPADAQDLEAAMEEMAG